MMEAAANPWLKLEVTAYGKDVGNFLARFFNKEEYKEYTEDVWHNTFVEIEPFDIYSFKEVSTKFDVSVEFRVG